MASVFNHGWASRKNVRPIDGTTAGDLFCRYCLIEFETWRKDGGDANVRCTLQDPKARELIDKAIGLRQ